MQRYSTAAPRIGKSRGGMKQPPKRGLIYNAMSKKRSRAKKGR